MGTSETFGTDFSTIHLKQHSIPIRRLKKSRGMMKNSCINIFLVMVMVACMQDVHGCLATPCQRCKANCCSRWVKYPLTDDSIPKILSNEQRNHCEDDCDNKSAPLQRQCPDLRTILDEYTKGSSYKGSIQQEDDICSNFSEQKWFV